MHNSPATVTTVVEMGAAEDDPVDAEAATPTATRGSTRGSTPGQSGTTRGSTRVNYDEEKIAELKDEVCQNVYALAPLSPANATAFFSRLSRVLYRWKRRQSV